jgi:hypothetical protein
MHHRPSSISISDHLRTFKINPDLAAAAPAVNETEMPVLRPASGCRIVGGVDSFKVQ